MRALVLAALAGVLALAAPPPAAAADPILPLDEVRPGQRCTGLTVVRGTEIAAFDVEVIDVVAPTRSAAPRILLRVSGPAVDATGIASGFSGSPVLCSGADGTPRNAGAISQTVGEYGGRTGLATPIEQMLAEPADPPADTLGGRPEAGAARAAAAAGAAAPRAGRVRVAPRLFGRARPLSAPLAVAGVNPRLGRALAAASRRGRTQVVAVPAAPLAAFGPQSLRGGASVAASLSSGDLALGAIGTVTYVDGDTIYAFGHELEGAGRRGLFLQDAYVFTVVANPLDLEERTSYKLATPGHDLGTVSNDSLVGAVGRTGPLPDRTRLSVHARDLDTGRRASKVGEVADEAALGVPSGVPPLSAVAPLALLDQVGTILGAIPARQTGELCVRLRLRADPAPLRFCNRYVVEGRTGEGVGPLGPLMSNDLDAALALVGGATYADLQVADVDASMRIRRGLAQATIERVRAPRRVRAGQRIRVVLEVRVLRGPLRRIAFGMRVPRLRPGSRELTFTGVEPDASLSEDAAEIVIDILNPGEDGEEEPPGGEGGGEGGDEGPERISSPEELRESFAGLSRYDGLTLEPGDQPVYRDPTYRIGGTGSVRVRVVR